MLNDPVDPNVREIFWMGASQVMGKTVCLILLVLYVIQQMRKSIVMVRPTELAAIDWKRDKLLPTINVTPCMAGLLVDPRKKDSQSTSLNHRYPGGSLRIIGANSPSGFRSSSAPVVLQDEVDAFTDNAEGDPCALADRAVINFSDAWMIKTSTTTIEGASRIYAGYKTGDQQKYFVPCPLCGGFQDLKTEQMKFSFTAEEHARFLENAETLKAEKLKSEAPPKSFREIVNGNTWEIGAFAVQDTPRTIYVCEHCHRGWTDAQRIDAYLSGHPDNPPVIPFKPEIGPALELRADWRATAPFTGIRSRHMNGMYGIGGLKKKYVSYLHQWAEEFLAAKRGGRAKLMTWTNIFKNEPFAEASEKMEWQPLKERAEDFGPDLEPQAVLVLGSMDVQQNPPRVEILWVAFGVLEEAWLLEWEVVAGDMDMPDTQERLAAHIKAKRFTHPYLGELAPYAMAIDYGHQTKVKAVFHFCKEHRTCGTTKIYPIKGFDHSLGAVWEQHYDKRYRVQKFYFNVDAFKSEIFDRLKITEAGARCIHIPKETVSYIARDGVRRSYSTTFNTSFYTELCSERRVAKRKPDGTMSYAWVKISQSARNEPLDLMDYVYGLYETQKLGGWIGQQYARVQRMMREREEKAKAEGGNLKPEGGGPAANATGPQPEADKEIPPPESLVRSGKIEEPRPQQPATRPVRRPRPPMRRRPPWMGGGGFFNPAGVPH